MDAMKSMDNKSEKDTEQEDKKEPDQINGETPKFGSKQSTDNDTTKKNNEKEDTSENEKSQEKKKKKQSSKRRKYKISWVGTSLSKALDKRKLEKDVDAEVSIEKAYCIKEEGRFKTKKS